MQVKTKKKTNLYIYGIMFLSIIFSILIGTLFFNATRNAILSIIEAILIFIPMTEIVTKVIQNILGKIVKPKIIPKMDLSKGIDKSNTTMVVIPTIIENRRKSKRTCRKARSFLSCKQIGKYILFYTRRLHVWKQRN